MHWAVWAGVGSCQHLFPFTCKPQQAPREAPRWPQYYPKGIVGNLALKNKWGLFRQHGRWDARLGTRAGGVRTPQLRSPLFVLMNIARSPGGFPSPAERHHLHEPPSKRQSDSLQRPEQLQRSPLPHPGRILGRCLSLLKCHEPGWRWSEILRILHQVLLRFDGFMAALTGPKRVNETHFMLQDESRHHGRFRKMHRHSDLILSENTCSSHIASEMFNLC